MAFGIVAFYISGAGLISTVALPLLALPESFFTRTEYTPAMAKHSTA
jgi:hypothetical protein